MDEDDLEDELFGDIYDDDVSGLAAARSYLEEDVASSSNQELQGGAEQEKNSSISKNENESGRIETTGKKVVVNLNSSSSQRLTQLRTQAFLETQKLHKSRQRERNSQVDELVALRIAKSILENEKELTRENSTYNLGYLLSFVEFLSPNEIWNFTSKKIQNTLTTPEKERTESYTNMSLETEVEARLEGLAEFDLDSLIHVYIPNGKDPLFKVQKLDQEFRNVLSGSSTTPETEEEQSKAVIVEEEVVIGYLKMVLNDSKNSESYLSSKTINSIPHIEIRRNANVHFTLHRLGTAVAKTLENLVLLKGNSCELEDIVRYVKTAQRVLLRAILIVYPELFYAEIKPETRSLYVLHERVLYTVAVVIEQCFLMDFCEKRMVKVFSDSVAEKDAEIAKTCVQIVHSLSSSEIRNMLQLNETYAQVDFKEVVWSLKRIGKVSTPFSKIEQVVNANRLIPLCVSRHFDNNSKGASLGADDLLPIFIYCLLQALPTDLESSIQIMSTFSDHVLQGGEAGYALTTLQTASQVISQLQIPTIES